MKQNWLSYLVYLLLTVLSLLGAWQIHVIGQFPNSYVRLERYRTDLSRVEQMLTRIDGKMDRILERN